MQRLHIFLSTVLLIILFASSNTAIAQKAPEFSNDLLMANKTYTYIIADKLEYQSMPGPNPIMWEIQGYIGKDLHKFWFKSDGETLTTGDETELEFQGLYSRAISRYFDLQAGIRYDLIYEGSENLSRGFAVIGFQGMAPYFFEVDGGFFISEDGDVSASFEAEYDLLITQRLIGQPLIETSLAFQDVPAYGIGSGLNDIELGFRLRYEIEREFAPYIGINWERKLGKTADMYADPSSVSLLGGIRMWF